MVIGERNGLSAVVLLVGLVGVPGTRHGGLAMIRIGHQRVLSLPVIHRVQAVAGGDHLIEARINLVGVVVGGRVDGVIPEPAVLDTGKIRLRKEVHERSSTRLG